MRISLLIVTLLAYALRLYCLDAQSLWYDEGVTATIAQLDLAELTRWTANDIQPPLYYYLVALWGRMAGWSEWSLRFVSAFFGTLAIPLMAVVANHLFNGFEKPSFSKKLGFLTFNLRSSVFICVLFSALLVALHPLFIYYSQEARMYTLLTTLTLLTVYGLLRSNYWPFIALYIFASIGAIYTHYFAFFLLLALAVSYLCEWLLEIRKKTWDGVQTDTDRHRFFNLRTYLAANLIILLCYLPWFMVMFNRLAVDSSYWQGNLKFWEALQQVIISFLSGESATTQETRWLIPLYSICSLILFWQLWRNRREQTRLLLYTIPWLLIPVGSILLLATFVPKFNARYVMLALPSLLLLWSAGLGGMSYQLSAISRQPSAVSRQRSATCHLLLATCLPALLMLGGFIYTSQNWFYDPAFTKDQWRELSGYVREQQTKNKDGDELVVLVSGHTWPVWEYYAPDMPALHLPDIDILDVDAVVDLEESAQALRTALMGKAGVWLVGWQDEIVDPMNSVATQLELSGWEKSVRPKFWGPTLRHFIWLDLDRLQTESASQQKAEESTNFGHQITLFNHAITNTGDLVLFWQVNEHADLGKSDLHIIVRSFTQDGRLPLGETAQQRLAGYAYPSYRWQSGQIVISRILAGEWSGGGTLPDNYQIRVSVYEDQQPLTIFEPDGTPQGQEAVREIALHVAISAGPLQAQPYGTVLVPEMLAALATTTETQVESGQPWYLKMHWAVYNEPGDRDFDLYIRWINQDDGQVVSVERLLLAPHFPTNRWDDDDGMLRTFTPMRVPDGLPTGEYWLDIMLVDHDAQVVTVLGDRIRLPLTVLPSTRLFEAPELAEPFSVTFGKTITLLGLQEPLTNVRAGDLLSLKLVWQADAIPTTDYQATVQFLNELGQPVTQQDVSLPDGSSNWLVGQVQIQDITLPTPSESGLYTMIIALYDASRSGFPRLPLPTGQDFLEIRSIQIDE